MFNKAILVGRLTADPELKQTPNGVSVTSFSIAVDRPYKGADGEKQVDFLEIVAWRKTAEFICQYFSKGRPILIEGQIQVRQFVDKNNQKRRVYEIVAEQARFVGSKNDSQGGGSPNVNYGEPPPTRGGSTQAQQPSHSSVGSPQDFEEIDPYDDDGDLPF